MSWLILQGDARRIPLRDNSVDAIVTDPPGGIFFMSKSWDENRGGRKQWVAYMTECFVEILRVCKPGAHAFVWAFPRTSHWTATALEDAGWQIREKFYHLFGSGFPKNLDVSKQLDKAAGAKREVVGKRTDRAAKPKLDIRGGKLLGEDRPTIDLSDITAPATESAKLWQGWGTATKPAAEEWILARKPLSESSVAANVLKWGTGALNIDGGRIDTGESTRRPMGQLTSKGLPGGGFGAPERRGNRPIVGDGGSDMGRWPSNVLLDEEAAELLDEQSGKLTSGAWNGKRNGDKFRTAYGEFKGTEYEFERPSSIGGASRFFYTAKASRSERGTEEIIDSGTSKLKLRTDLTLEQQEFVLAELKKYGVRL